MVGIDLAWGEKRPDGLCFLLGYGARITHVSYGLSRGDAELRARLRESIPDACPALLCLDAPVVCPNRTGSRPVDRLTHRMFHRVQAGAHPANRTRCARPLRVVRTLRRAGFTVTTEWTATKRSVAEVYPHPATVRWFGLDRTLKYKRGPAKKRRREFARLQKLLRNWLGKNAPDIALHAETRRLLCMPWTKDTEDMTDALLGALIGWQWTVHGPDAVEILGDERSGFIVLPKQNSLIGPLRSSPRTREKRTNQAAGP